MIKKTSALILAAGESSRMGIPKFMLNYDDKYTFLEKIIEQYTEFGCKEIRIVLNQQGAEVICKRESDIIDNKQIVLNSFPELEKFYSIQIGLRALVETDRIFIHPVDNPFVIPLVLSRLINNYDKGDYQVPTFKNKGGHPVLISGKIREEIIKLDNTDIIFKDFLTNFTQFRVEVEHPEILININTEADYFKFKEIQEGK